MRIALFALASSLATASVAAAQGAHGVGPSSGGTAEVRPSAERAMARWPQSVRVGDLVGRQFLENTPKQYVLGRVAGVIRGPDGKVAVIVDRGGILGFGTRRIAVPVEATALLGQFVVLVDLGVPELDALPAMAGADLPPDDSIRIGLTRN